MRHYERLERIQNIDEYEDYDGFCYFADETYIHIRATFCLNAAGQRTSAYVLFIGKSLPDGDELWSRPVTIDLPVAKLEAIIQAQA